MESEPDCNLHDSARVVAILDIISARYDLQIQQHQEHISRLKQLRERSTQNASEPLGPDFVIHPRRAA